MCIDNKKKKLLSLLAINPESAIRCHQWDGYPINEDTNSSEYRTIFMSDRDRILYCTGFLRLAVKTQVYAPNTGDHQRTRLTHGHL